MCRFGDVLCVGLGMYFVRVWGCIVCRFGVVLCVGLGLYFVRVWDVLCVGSGNYCV